MKLFFWTENRAGPNGTTRKTASFKRLIMEGAFDVNACEPEPIDQAIPLYIAIDQRRPAIIQRMEQIALLPPEQAQAELLVIMKEMVGL